MMVTLPYIDRDRKLTVTLPYNRGVSESLKRMLEEVDVRVRMKPHRTLRQILVKPKDQVLNEPTDRGVIQNTITGKLAL